MRLAVLANFDSPHAWRWIKVFIERAHDVHAISYYQPRAELPGATLHVLRRRSNTPGTVNPSPAASRSGSRVPPAALRLLNAVRFSRAGLRGLLRDLAPDVFHAHYIVEHGFFGALAGYHPFVASAWGSDLFQAPRSPAGSWIARYVLKRADLVTGNDGALVREAIRLGALQDRVALVRLGLDREFLETAALSANLKAAGSDPPTIFSHRALERLYNIDVAVRAFARVRERLPAARLIIAGDGSLRARLERLAGDLGVAGFVQFLGRVDQEQLRRFLTGAHVYVSVPSSDSLALSTMEAMACGAFPVVSDLPSQEWITHRVNGLRAPVRDEKALAECLYLALTDAGMRREAVSLNRARVEAEGSLEKNMLVMERRYYRLAGKPLAEEAL